MYLIIIFRERVGKIGPSPPFGQKDRYRKKVGKRNGLIFFKTLFLKPIKNIKIQLINKFITIIKIFK